MAMFDTEYEALQAELRQGKELAQHVRKEHLQREELDFWEKVYITTLRANIHTHENYAAFDAEQKANTAVKHRQTFISNQKFIAECKERGE